MGMLDALISLTGILGLRFDFDGRSSYFTDIAIGGDTPRATLLPTKSARIVDAGFV